MYSQGQEERQRRRITRLQNATIALLLLTFAGSMFDARARAERMSLIEAELIDTERPE